MWKFRNAALLFCVLFLASCASEEKAELDQQLQETMKESSGGFGSGYYRLPFSDAYSQIPQDPKNALTEKKIELGKALFHETGLAIRPKYTEGHACYSCASCHHAGGGFQANRVQGIGDGGWGFGTAGEGRDISALYPPDSIDVQPIRTPSALNSAYQRLMLWNGQFGAGGDNAGTEANWTAGTPKETNHLGYQGVEIQAIAGLKVHRMDVTLELMNSLGYTELFDEVFPEFDPADRYSKETAGLAIAAFERSILANESPFQEWIRGDFSAMTEDQKKGALLFFGDANCYQCHNGPGLNSMQFHALGMHDLDGIGVYGNSANDSEQKGRGGFTGRSQDDYKFKVPQLYNLTDSPFFGHGGNFTTVRSVLEYKNEAVSQNPVVPEESLSMYFTPLGLSDVELGQLTTFIEDALYDDDLERYVPNELPSGLCFPNADIQSVEDLGCN